MPDKAYVLINVHPGQTANVVKALTTIKEIKQIDPCWGNRTFSPLSKYPIRMRLPSWCSPKFMRSPVSIRRTRTWSTAFKMENRNEIQSRQSLAAG